jgi:S1-C subfamily serine protease
MIKRSLAVLVLFLATSLPVSALTLRIFVGYSGYGSGSAISSTHILTARHVIHNHNFVEVTDGYETYQAQVVYVHPERDIAVLEILEGELSPVTFEVSENLPGTLGSTEIYPSIIENQSYVMHGVVLPAGNNKEVLTMQMPAFPGCSGALVLDTDGKVIGMLIQVYQYSRIGYPIGKSVLVPGDILKDVLVKQGFIDG